MDALRAAVDAAEAEMDSALYPYPTYEALVYGHHF
jgi:glutamine synthetase type III